MLRDLIIIDGYNLLNSWKEIEDILRESFEHARGIMIEKVLNHFSFLGKKAILVFDAHLVKKGKESRERIGNIEIIYSAEGQTADMVIEKICFELKDRYRVYVVTSDRTEQDVIWASGGLRISSREFIREILARESEITNRKERCQHKNTRLETHLSGEIYEKLEKIRRHK